MISQPDRWWVVRAYSAEEVADRLYNTDSHLIHQGAAPVDFATVMRRSRFTDGLREAKRRARQCDSVHVRTRSGYVDILYAVHPRGAPIHCLMGVPESVCRDVDDVFTFPARDRDGAMGVMCQEFGFDEPTAAALLDPAYASEDGIAEVAIGETATISLEAGAQYYSGIAAFLVGEGSGGGMLVAQPLVYVTVPKPGAAGFVWHN
jgi:hypothetical protein